MSSIYNSAEKFQGFGLRGAGVNMLVFYELLHFFSFL